MIQLNDSSQLSLRQLDTALTFGKYSERIHVGPWGCGKTRAIILGFGLWCYTHKPGKLGFLLLGKTASLAKQSMGDTLVELFGDDFKYTTSKKQDSKTKDAVLFGHRIYFGGMHDSQSIKRVLGKSYKAIIIDELTSISEDNYQQLKGRLRGDPPHWLEASTNPDAPTHWLFHYLGLDIESEVASIEYRCVKRIQLQQWTRHDALYEGAVEYYRNLEQTYSPDSIYYARGVLGHWMASGDLVYGDSFNPKEHIINEDDLRGATFKYFKVGIDFGMENPTVALICGVMPAGEHVIIDEVYMPHAKNLNTVVDNIINLLNKYYSSIGRCEGIYIDPSASVLIKALKTAGVLNIKQADNSVLEGIQVVNTMFNTFKLFISSKCKHTLNEIYTYCYSKKLDETVEKHDDHCMDAMRYIVSKLREVLTVVRHVKH